MPTIYKNGHFHFGGSPRRACPDCGHEAQPSLPNEYWSNYDCPECGEKNIPYYDCPDFTEQGKLFEPKEATAYEDGSLSPTTGDAWTETEGDDE